ncbi:pseudouridine synthase [Ancylobacter sp. WKF20]|uniref:pseudouridine synthase n=1 Tax=Ancylobacter sp. WKF20 TaxID=3039801 RepID=UPI0024345D1C|nr:pseudouridine synthase [Ancylobacter sp. WKF20]WGD29371.1 pseudouridine synthase [Ancylobacter sp. WKF20]
MPKNTPPRKEQNRVPRAPRALAPAEPREAERIAKVVARAGLGSRREIEEWILAGRVAVNGEVLESPARTVTAEDTITVDGVKLPEKERTRLYLYHKPKGVVTTNYDPEGRPTLFEILPGGLPRLVSVGRLDLNTEGLILLTNDGGLARVLELPETGWLRRYRVRAKGDITQDKLDALIAGITVDGVHYGPIEAVLDRVQGANVWLTLALREGKNREVRNVLGSLGLDVNRLIRLSYGPFQLGEIVQGSVEEVRTRILMDQLGPELAAAAGADFEGPVFDHAVEDEAPRKPSKARYAKVEGAEDRPRRRPIDTEAGPDKTVSSGLVADRKGRKVLVQRVRSTEPAPTEEERPFRDERRPERPGRGPSRDRKAAGPRPSRPRDAEDRAPRADHEERGGERTFRGRSERPARSTEDRPVRSEGDRPFRERAPRAEGDRPFRERAPRAEGDRPFRERAPRAEGDRPFRERAPRPEGDRPFRERAPRAEGDRPFRERAPRPEGDRPFRERAPRAEGDRPFRERAPRPEGDRPFRERAPRAEGDRPFRERAPRPEGDRPFRERAPRPEGGRPYRGADSDRPFSGRVKSEENRTRRPRFAKLAGSGDTERAPREEHPRREEGDRPARNYGAKNFADRPTRSFGDKPRGERPAVDRPRGERPAGKSFGDRPFGDKPRGKSFGDKPGGRPAGGRPGGKSFGDKPSGGKSFGGKPSGGRPSGGKPSGGRPSGGKPSGGKPGGRPGRPPRG